jgi:hypothetical protein
VAEPSRFLKILGAWWIALSIAIPAAVMIYIIGLVFQAFDLTTEKLQPFMQASGEAVIRIAAAAGVARGLFAPTRPNWRLPKLNDKATEAIVRATISVACVVSVTRLFEALNDIRRLLAGRRHHARHCRLCRRHHAWRRVVALWQHTGYRRMFRPTGCPGEELVRHFSTGFLGGGFHHRYFGSDRLRGL